jgi:hypothetical protein
MPPGLQKVQSTIALSTGGGNRAAANEPFHRWPE